MAHRYERGCPVPQVPRLLPLGTGRGVQTWLRGADRRAPGPARPKAPQFRVPGGGRFAAGNPRFAVRHPALSVSSGTRRYRWRPPNTSTREMCTGERPLFRKTGAGCSQRNAVNKLRKLDFRALLPSRIRAPTMPVRQREGRCSPGLPPLQGFLPRSRAPAFTGTPLAGFTAAPARRPCWRLPHRVFRPRGRLVSFETAAPLEVSHLVAWTPESRTRFPSLDPR
jgi:hypothetical protein